MIGKTGMEPDAVVEGFNVVEDCCTSLDEAAEAMMIDQFVFESAEEGLDKGVIVTVAFPAHGSG